MIENCSLHFRVLGVLSTLAVGGYPARSPSTAEIEKSGIRATPSRNLASGARAAAGIRHGRNFESPGNRVCRRKRRLVYNASGCGCSAEREFKG